LKPMVEQIQKVCSEEDIVLTLGFDWDPTILNACRRRGLMVPDWPEVNVEVVRQSLAALVKNGYRIGAIVYGRGRANGIRRHMLDREVQMCGMPVGGRPPA